MKNFISGLISGAIVFGLFGTFAAPSSIENRAAFVNETNNQSELKTIAEGIELTIKLPFPKGQSYLIAQAYNGEFSHKDDYALDFIMPEGSLISSVSPGKVIVVEDSFAVNGKTPEFAKFNNYIVIDHGQGYYGHYYHIKESLVEVGQVVEGGQNIAFSGNVGFSTTPHLHFEMTNRHNHTVPTRFVEIPGESLVSGKKIVSQNDGVGTGPYIPTQSLSWSFNGIVIDELSPAWEYTKGDAIKIKGKVTNGERYAVVFIMSKNGGQSIFHRLSRVKSDGSFESIFQVPANITKGNYRIAFDSSNDRSFWTNNSFLIYVK
jgi:hypothetical protein